MNTHAISAHNYNTNFGSSFRVSCNIKKDDDAIGTFVNPYKEKKLYKQLNSQIIKALNTEFLQNLRAVYGISTKKSGNQLSSVEKSLIEDLKKIDKDYNELNLTRSLYPRYKLGYIITGSDVSIVENLKGVGGIGKVRTDSLWANGNSNNAYVRKHSRSVTDYALEYANNSDVLLRSNNNKEIMLQATFKEVGTNKSGTKKYVLDSYDFHENISLPDLKPVSESHKRYKNSQAIKDEIKTTVQYYLNKMSGKRIHFNDLEELLHPQKKQTPKEEAIQASPKEPMKQEISKETPIVKEVEQKIDSCVNPFAAKPIQLSLDFGENF